MTKFIENLGGRKSAVFWASFITFNIFFALKYDMTSYTVGVTSLSAVFGIGNLGEHKIKKG